MAWTDSGGGGWLAPSRALLPDDACSGNPALAAALCAEGVPLVIGLLRGLLATWREAMPAVRHIAPAAVRAHLRARGARLALASLPEQERLQVGRRPRAQQASC